MNCVFAKNLFFPSPNGNDRPNYETIMRVLSITTAE